MSEFEQSQPEPSDTRDTEGRLVDKDTAQFAAEAIMRRDRDASWQESRDVNKISSQKNHYYKTTNTASLIVGAGIGRSTQEQERVSRAEKYRQTSPAKTDALEKAVVGDLVAGTSNISEDGAHSPRVEEIRKRHLLSGIRAKIFGEKPLK